MERLTLTPEQIAAEDFAEHLSLAAKGIRDGYVICAPLENSYAFFVNAFSEMGVRTMHVLRGAALGVAAQVMVTSAETVNGIARDISDDAKALMEKFWPGQLSLNLRPNQGLNWNLGDNKELDEFSVRVPESAFIRALLKEVGPLAVASASRVGLPPARSTDDIFVLESDLAVMIDMGTLEEGAPTTIVEADPAAIRVLRVGAIPLAELSAVVPSISAE